MAPYLYNTMIDNWGRAGGGRGGREISQTSVFVYTTYIKSIIGTGRLIIWLIIIAFCIDLAAAYAFQSI